MADTNKLVINLLRFCIQLHLVRQWLPFTAATGTEVLAERFKPVRRRLHNLCNITFHVAVLFYGHDIHNISRDCKLHKEDHSVYMCDCFAFCCYSFYSYSREGDPLVFT